MKNNEGLALILMCFLLVPVSSIAQQAELSKEMRKINFTAINPPRTDFAPGLIYRNIRDVGGHSQMEVLCRDMFADTPGARVTSKWLLSKRQYSAGFSLSAIFSWLSGKVTEKADASGEAKAAFDWSKGVNVSFGDIQHTSVPVENRFSDAKPVTLTAACKAALDAHKKIDPQLRNLFVVAESLSASKLSISVNKSVAAKLEADVKLSELVEVKPGVGFTYKNDGSLEGSPSVPITIGYYAMRVKEYSLPDGAIAGGNARIAIDEDDTDNVSESNL